MRVRTFGTGVPVVSIPGLAGGSGMFDGIHRVMAGAGCRVLALDLAGDRWDQWVPALSFEGYVEQLDQLWQRELGAPAILMGTSFGSLLALEALAARPDRWRALILVSPPLPPPLPGLGHRVRRAIRSWGGHRAVCGAATAVFFAMVAWEGIHPVTLWRARAQLDAIADARTPAKTIDEKLRLLYDVWKPERLPRSDQPALLLRGALDPISRRAAPQLLSGYLSRLEAREIPWAGHALHVSRPKVLASALLEFTQRQDAG
ncbi:MAG TPA: alpha/beta hydrolase [Acidobacteriota bacterium]